MVYLSSGTSDSTPLSAGTWTGSSLTFVPAGSTTPEGAAHQGLAFRGSDGMLYAVEVAAGPGGPHLLVLDRTGTITPLGVLDSLTDRPGTVAGGTFGQGPHADTYFAVVTDTTQDGGQDVLLAVGVAADGTLTETMTPLDLPAGARLGDLAPSGGYLWGVQGQEIFRVDPGDGSATGWTLPAGTVGPGAETVFGIAWSSGDGHMAFGSHDHSEITELTVSDQASDVPTFEVLARHGTPIGLQSDGTFAPAADPAEVPSPGAPTLEPRQPSAPEIDPTDGTRFAGHGVPGHTVTVTFPDGSTARATVDADGAWAVQAPSITFVHGHLVEATATDLAGATSEPACRTVDLIPAEDPAPGTSTTQTSAQTPQRGGRQ